MSTKDRIPQPDDFVRDPNGVLAKVERVNGGMAYIVYSDGHAMVGLEGHASGGRPMTPPLDLSLSEVPTADLIAAFHLALARYRARAHVERSLVGLSREPIQEARR